MKAMQTMGRQGDVLIINERNLNLRPETKKRLFKVTGKAWDAGKEKRLKLAEGEVSGHCHAIQDINNATLYVSNDIQETLKHLEVKGDCSPTHEEHDSFKISEGMNAVLIQNENRLGLIYQVRD